MTTEPPPSCRLSEERFIAAIVHSEGSILHEYPVVEYHFFTPGARVVFGAIQALRNRGIAVNILVLQSELGHDSIKDLGDAYHRMTDFVPASHAAALYSVLVERAAGRRMYEIGTKLISGASDMNSAAEVRRHAVSQLSDLEVSTKSENLLGSALSRFREKLDCMDRGELPRIRLGPIKAWNNLFGGLHDGKYYAIAARPGMGKTSLLEQIVTQYLKYDETVVVFERDMSVDMLVERIACREAEVPHWRVERNQLSAEQRSRIVTMLSGLDDEKLRIYNPSDLTVEKLCQIARQEIRERNAKLVALDHIQCLQSPGMDLREGLTVASIAIRANVNDTGVSHLVLAQINRDGANGRPEPEQIKGFDQLRCDVDAMANLYCPDTERFLDALRPMRLYAAKNRFGSIGEESVQYRGALMRFEDSSGTR